MSSKPPLREPNTIICPKCAHKMHRVSDVDLCVHKCEACAGLWFPGGRQAAERLKAAATQIEDAHAHPGEALDLVRSIDCPTCQRRMQPMADASQRHIRYEACIYCNGIFLDAGELTDLSEHTWGEQLREAIRVFKAHYHLL